MEQDNISLIPTKQRMQSENLLKRILDFVSKWRQQILLFFGLVVLGVFLFVVLAILTDNGLYNFEINQLGLKLCQAQVRQDC